jgi:hypothetical protein
MEGLEKILGAIVLLALIGAIFIGKRNTRHRNPDEME